MQVYIAYSSQPPNQYTNAKHTTAASTACWCSCTIHLSSCCCSICKLPSSCKRLWSNLTNNTDDEIFMKQTQTCWRMSKWSGSLWNKRFWPTSGDLWCPTQGAWLTRELPGNNLKCVSATMTKTNTHYVVSRRLTAYSREMKMDSVMMKQRIVSFMIALMQHHTTMPNVPPPRYRLNMQTQGKLLHFCSAAM